MVVSGIGEDDGKIVSHILFIFDPIFSFDVCFFGAVWLPEVTLPMWHLCHHNKIPLQLSQVAYTCDNSSLFETFLYFSCNLWPCLAGKMLLAFAFIFLGAFCHDDIEIWSLSSTGGNYKTICPETLDVICICCNFLICTVVFHEECSKTKLFIACKGIYSHRLFPLFFHISKKGAKVSTNPPSDRRSSTVKCRNYKTCREVAIMHALTNENSLWFDSITADEISIVN